MNCKKCGSNLEVGAAFCGTCGAPVNVNEVSEGASVNNSLETPSLNQSVPNVSESKVLDTPATQASVQTDTPSVSTPIESTNSVNAPVATEVNKEEATNVGDAMKAPDASVQNTGVLNNGVNQGSVVTSTSTSLNAQMPANAQVGEMQGVAQAPQNNLGNAPQASASVTGQEPSVQTPQVNVAPQPAIAPQNNLGQVNAMPSQPAQPNQMPANNVVNNQAKTNKTPFFIAAGGMGAVMVLLICLIASGGIKLNFTVSKGGEKVNSDNQTISAEKKDDKDNKDEKTTKSTTTRTTTVAPVSNEGKYVDYSDISVYVPDKFEYEFDEDDLTHSFLSNSKKQMINLEFLKATYDSEVLKVDNYKRTITSNGGTVTSDGASTYKGLKYYHINVNTSGINGEIIIMDFQNVGSIFAQIYTDFATESAYLDTLYEIATKSKMNGNSSTFAPNSNSTFAEEFKMPEMVNPTFE